MSSDPDDRRAFRTREAREAARRFLESLARRHRLRAVALAAENGSLITGATGLTSAVERGELEWLAAEAAIRGDAGSADADAHARPDGRLCSFSMAIGAYVLHVAALGAPGAPADVSLPIGECEAALRRIYEPLFCCAA